MKGCARLRTKSPRAVHPRGVKRENKLTPENFINNHRASVRLTRLRDFFYLPPPRFICYLAKGLPFGRNRLFYTFFWSYFLFCERVDKIAFRKSSPAPMNSNSTLVISVAYFRRTVRETVRKGPWKTEVGTRQEGDVFVRNENVFSRRLPDPSPTYDYSRPITKSLGSTENRNHVAQSTKKQEQRNYIPLCCTIYCSILNSRLTWFSILKHLSTLFVSRLFLLGFSP